MGFNSVLNKNPLGRVVFAENPLYSVSPFPKIPNAKIDVLWG